MFHGDSMQTKLFSTEHEMKGKSYSAKTIYQLLKSRQFINHIFCKVNNKTYTIFEHGVPGTFLRQNIKKKWWRMMVEEQSQSLPLERDASIIDDYLYLLSDQNVRTKSNLDHDVKHLNEHRRMYMDVLKLNKGCLPFSIVSQSQRLNIENSNDDDDVKKEERDLFLSGLIRTELVSQCFTAPSDVNRIFDFWLQQRLSWWKKYAKNPSKFSVSSCNERKSDDDRSSSHSNGQVMSINYEFPWGQDSVEVIHNHGDALFKSLPENEEKLFWAKTTGGKKCIPHCIQCTMNIEVAETTFLIDAYHERKTISHANKSSKANPVLQLHPQLCPFHSALLVVSKTGETNKELLHLCAKLEYDMQKAGVSVFNASRHEATQNAHFKRNDQLGIPYTLILNEETLHDGSIVIRCRDTDIMKPVHVSKAVDELRRNVKATLE